MKAMLGTLESEIESGGVHEKQLMKDLDNTRLLRKDVEDKLANQSEQVDLWIKILVDITERLTAQIAMMGMEGTLFSSDRHDDVGRNPRGRSFTFGVDPTGKHEKCTEEHEGNHEGKREKQSTDTNLITQGPDHRTHKVAQDSKSTKERYKGSRSSP